MFRVFTSISLCCYLLGFLSLTVHAEVAVKVKESSSLNTGKNLSEILVLDCGTGYVPDKALFRRPQSGISVESISVGGSVIKVRGRNTTEHGIEWNFAAICALKVAPPAPPSQLACNVVRQPAARFARNPEPPACAAGQQVTGGGYEFAARNEARTMAVSAPVRGTNGSSDSWRCRKPSALRAARFACYAICCNVQ